MPTTNLSETIDFNGQEFFVGLDVHKKSRLRTQYVLPGLRPEKY